MEEEFFDLSSFAVQDAEMEGKSLLETVKAVKPNIIIGKNFNHLDVEALTHLFFRLVSVWRPVQ